jgi:hypothetical protein
LRCKISLRGDRSVQWTSYIISEEEKCLDLTWAAPIMTRLASASWASHFPPCCRYHITRRDHDTALISIVFIVLTAEPLTSHVQYRQCIEPRSCSTTARLLYSPRVRCLFLEKLLRLLLHIQRW